MYLLKKEYPYHCNENKYKIHLSDREIYTIRTVIGSFVPYHQVNPTQRLSSQAVNASIRVLFFSLTVVVLFSRLHRVYAVWFQI